MELKPLGHFCIALCIRLLIVPCGIETGERTRESKSLTGLLIVPCGIETANTSGDVFQRTFLLIVPCGIETHLLAYLVRCGTRF